MDFRSSASGRPPFQKGKHIFSSRGVAKKKGGAFMSGREANRASSSLVKKSRKANGSGREKFPTLGRKLRDYNEEDIISIGSTDISSSSSDSESRMTPLRAAHPSGHPPVALHLGKFPPALLAEPQLVRSMSGGSRNGRPEADREEKVASPGRKEEDMKRVSDTESDTEESESSTEREPDDFKMSESESEKEEEDTESESESSPEGVDAGVSNPVRAAFSNVGRTVEMAMADGDVISIGSTDDEDMDDCPEEISRIRRPVAVSSRTRSKLDGRIGHGGVQGSASSSRNHQRMSKSSLEPRGNNAQKMKNIFGERKVGRELKSSTNSKEKNQNVRHLQSPGRPAKRRVAVSDVRKSEASGGLRRKKEKVEKKRSEAPGITVRPIDKHKHASEGSWSQDDESNSSMLKRKNRKMEAIKSSIEHVKKQKHASEDSGNNHDELDSSMLMRKNKKMEAIKRCIEPHKSQKHASDVHKPEDSGKSGNESSSSRPRRKDEKTKRRLEALSSSTGPIKEQTHVSDSIRESRDSGGINDKPSLSSSSDNAGSPSVREKRAPPAGNANSRSNRKFDFFQILCDSIWKKGDGAEDEVQKLKKIKEPLPVKFPWFDEEEPVVKSKEEEEMDRLWDTMNLSLQAEYIGSTHRNEESDSNESDIKTSRAAQCCRGEHYLILDEEIGEWCKFCSYIAVEIRDYYLPFEDSHVETQQRSYRRDRKSAAFDGLQFQDPAGCPDDRFSYFNSGTVWDLIPGIRDRMYLHQIEGFEFMWTNLAGSIMLDELRNSSMEKHKDIGGCIISHAPGTGKTRLTLVFLQSYIKLFPDSLPVIIAPASLLLTWEDEIKKWEVGVPFHNLNTDDISGNEDITALTMLESHRLSRNNDSIRLVKLYSWSKGKSILILSYELLVKLAGDNVQTDMKEILLKKPGLIILDEGHIPRNRDSKVWCLMLRLKTKKRVILSGTPFQNNFDELHNTLYVIRPRVAKSVPPHLKKFCQRRPGTQTDRDYDVGVEEMKKIVAPFVHLHKGSILQKSLPGLRECVVVLNPSELQAEVLRSYQGVENDSDVAGRKKKDCVFDFEHKQALISVHPSLALSFEADDRTSISSEKLEAHKLNPNEGVKTRFLFELLKLCHATGEKVLIFSQFLKPLDLTALQLSSVFSWTMGTDVLLMIGDLRMSQRQSMIKVFNDPDSKARVLLASTRACSEGINLVGASRVVLLDVVWNPSVEKQAISRAYRLGQKRVVYTYHLIMKGTTEWEKYQRQAHKYRLSEIVFSASTSKEENPGKKPVVISEDEMLDAMTSHPRLRDLFDQIRYQPKQLDLVENFGPVGEST